MAGEIKKLLTWYFALVLLVIGANALLGLAGQTVLASISTTLQTGIFGLVFAALAFLFGAKKFAKWDTQLTPE